MCFLAEQEAVAAGAEIEAHEGHTQEAAAPTAKPPRSSGIGSGSTKNTHNALGTRRLTISENGYCHQHFHFIVLTNEKTAMDSI